MASSATDSQEKDKDIRQQLVETGHVDVMLSVGNTFFYTKSLLSSLWFLDKGKKEDLLDKELFINARNYYTVVDRTLNEQTEWQLKNLNAIAWLYQGEHKKYQNLLQEYMEVLGDGDFKTVLTKLEEQKEQLIAESKKPLQKFLERKKISEANYAQKVSN